MAGWFITFEGPEGAGKSTQIRRLAADIRGLGLRVLETREPGGTAIGEEIRAILLNRHTAAMSPETEALLHNAARAQHVVEAIRPALERGEIVLCDRFADSTLAYQGGGRGLSIDALRALQCFATAGVAPNLRVLLDLDVAVGLSRRHGEAGTTNRMDHESLAFHQRVRDMYRQLAAEEPGSWIVVDAGRPVEVIAGEIVDAVTGALREGGFEVPVPAQVER